MNNTRNDLIKLCKEKKIKGYSKKSKEEILKMLNENFITNKSPLRYPGGKSRAIKILDEIVLKNLPDKKILLSPFFGGGSFELYLASKGFKVYGNDLFKPLFVFWQVLKNDKNKLINEINKLLPIDKDKFLRFRDNIMDEKNDTIKASYYFSINRTSFSGATLSGGFSKEASQKRLTKSSIKNLEECCLKNIEFSNLDCLDFINNYPENESTLLYLDPPYYIDKYIYGKDGDMHVNFNHKSLFDAIESRNDWILCYNDCQYIRELYKNFYILNVKWSYGMNKTKNSSEIIILPSKFRR
jgi:DNA adenine methylase